MLLATVSHIFIFTMALSSQNTVPVDLLEVKHSKGKARD